VAWTVKSGAKNSCTRILAAPNCDHATYQMTLLYLRLCILVTTLCPIPCLHPFSGQLAFQGTAASPESHRPLPSVSPSRCLLGNGNVKNALRDGRGVFRMLLCASKFTNPLLDKIRFRRSHAAAQSRVYIRRSFKSLGSSAVSIQSSIIIYYYYHSTRLTFAVESSLSLAHTITIVPDISRFYRYARLTTVDRCLRWSCCCWWLLRRTQRYKPMAASQLLIYH
jgi:hypothetical protein